jgi:hypothetical protein
MWWLCARPRLTRAVWLSVGAVAAAYLWAFAFGKGIPGYMTTAALNRHPGTFPDANAAFAVAAGAFLLTPVPVYLCAPLQLRGSGRSLQYPILLAVCAVGGAALFGATEATRLL